MESEELPPEMLTPPKPDEPEAMGAPKPEEMDAPPKPEDYEEAGSANP